MAGKQINRYIDEGKIPGGIFILARYGTIVFILTAGNCSKGQGVPYRDDENCPFLAQRILIPPVCHNLQCN